MDEGRASRAERRQAEYAAWVVRREAYNASTHPDNRGSLEHALSLLRWLNADWELSSYSSDVQQLPEALTSLTNPHALTQVKSLSLHPFIFRMNFISQLSTTWLSRHLD